MSIGQFGVGDVICINSKIIRNEVVVIREMYRAVYGQGVKCGSTTINVVVETSLGDVFAFEAGFLEDCVKAPLLTALLLFGRSYD